MKPYPSPPNPDPVSSPGDFKHRLVSALVSQKLEGWVLPPEAPLFGAQPLRTCFPSCDDCKDGDTSAQCKSFLAWHDWLVTYRKILDTALDLLGPETKVRVLDADEYATLPWDASMTKRVDAIKAALRVGPAACQAGGSMLTTKRWATEKDKGDEGEGSSKRPRI